MSFRTNVVVAPQKEPGRVAFFATESPAEKINGLSQHLRDVVCKNFTVLLTQTANIAAFNCCY